MYDGFLVLNFMKGMEFMVIEFKGSEFEGLINFSIMLVFISGVYGSVKIILKHSGFFKDVMKLIGILEVVLRYFKKELVPSPGSIKLWRKFSPFINLFGYIYYFVCCILVIIICFLPFAYTSGISLISKFILMVIISLFILLSLVSISKTTWALHYIMNKKVDK